MSDEQLSALDSIAEALSGTSEEATSEEVVSEESTEEAQSEESENQEQSEELAASEGESQESEGESEEVEVKAETEEELEKELEEAAEKGATKEELVDMVRQYTLKVQGKEFVKELDLNDEEAVKRELQMAAMAPRSMQRVKELEKYIDSEAENIKADPFGYMEKLGLDPIQLAASKIEDYLAEKAKSPEQIEAERRAREIEEIKAENERLKKQAEEKERAAALAQAEKEIESDIISALEGDQDLEASPEVINMVVDNMLWAMTPVDQGGGGFQDVSAKDVLPTVKAELKQKYKAYAKSMKSTTALKSLLGDDILNSLREERIEKVKNQVSNINNIKKTPSPEKKGEEPKKKVSLKDFMGM